MARVMRSSGVLFVLALLSVISAVLVSCGKAGEIGDAKSSEKSEGDGRGQVGNITGAGKNHERAAEVEPVMPSEGSAGVVLIKAGTEPRRVLRYGGEVGRRFAMNVLVEMETSSSVDGKPVAAAAMPMLPESMESGITGQTTDVNAEGESRVEVVWTGYRMKMSGEVDAKRAKAIETIEQLLLGSRSEVLVSGAGVVKSVSTQPAEGDASSMPEWRRKLSSSLDQLIKDVYIRLPAESVGVGAKWRTVEVVEGRGARAKRTTSFEVRSYEGEDVVIDIDMRTDVLEEEHRPEGKDLTIRTMKGSGSGTGVAVLRPGVPVVWMFTLETSQYQPVTTIEQGREVNTEVWIKSIIKASTRDVQPGGAEEGAPSKLEGGGPEDGGKRTPGSR